MVVPPGEAPRLDIQCAASRLELPSLPAKSIHPYSGFARPEAATPMKKTILEPDRDRREIHYDVENDRTTFLAFRDDGRVRIDDIGTVVSYRKDKSSSIANDDPSTLRQEVTTSQGFERDDWKARLETSVVMTCDKGHFVFESWAKAHAGDELIFERRYAHRVKRDHM
jgi:hypothetical protein